MRRWTRSNPSGASDGWRDRVTRRGLASAWLAFALAVGSVVLVPNPASALVEVVGTERVSVTVGGGEAGDGSYNAAVSGDGSLIVFDSDATNLVAGDTNDATDVFLRDRQAGATVRISDPAGPAQADGDSFGADISGTSVAYYSFATNLVAGDTNGVADVFVYDTVTAVTDRVSVASDGTQGDLGSFDPSITDDGSLVIFVSASTTLVPGDTNAVQDVFLHDRSTGTTVRITDGFDGSEPDGASSAPAISADGSTVVFHSSATNLVAGDTNLVDDVFVYDVATATITRVSVGPAGAEATGDSGFADVSADGTMVVFHSTASDLVSGDTNGLADIFAHDRGTGVTTRVSVATDGSEGTGASRYPSVSGDGETVVFQSFAGNLVSGDANGTADIFAHDRRTAETTRVSVAGTGTEGDGFSFFPAVAADGGTVAYESDSTNLVSGDGNAVSDVFVTETNRAPIASGSTQQVPEDVVVGSPVGAVTVTEPDGDGVTFDITAGNDAGLFQVDAAGSVTTAGALDYETATLHILTVTVSDGSLAASALVTVEVTDVPDTGTTTTAPTTTTTTAPTTTTTTAPTTTTTAPTTTTTAPTTTTTAPTTTTTAPTTTTTTTLPPTTVPPPPPDYDPFDDDDNSVFQSDIEWLALAGITSGCGDRSFCPADSVTRGQMAAFLVRALNLPPAGRDYFIDDNLSVFQDDINRLAESGITSGCTAITFCPNDSVTRAQMAAFLVRAFGYADDGGGDLFTDDDKSIFEADIDRLATAGVTKGCSSDRFCPSDDVTRAQMAAFLRRAIEE